MNVLQALAGIITLLTYLFIFGFRAFWFWYVACFLGVLISPAWSAEWWQSVMFAVGVILLDVSDES